MGEWNIAVVGAGPVGGILAGQLICGGNRVTLIDIFEEHMAAIRNDGLAIEGLEPFTTRVDSSYLSLGQAAEAGERFELIFVCVKAPAVRHVARDLPLVLSTEGAAASFQNGLDTESGLLEVIGPERTLRGVVNYAGNLAGLGRLRRTFFNPPNYLGAAVRGTASAEERARRVAQRMSAAGLTTEHADDIQWHVWEKALRNAALMPVSALTGQNIAQVMGSQSSLHLVETMLTEAIAVADAVGYKFDRHYCDETLAYYRMAGEHMPSMRGDVVDGRQTEIEFLNHKIAEYGDRHGIACPYNRAVANLLLCIDEVAAERGK